MARTEPHITTFDLAPGRMIGGKYRVERLLGGGWEGEVYEVVERRTGAARAAKLFFPHRNEDDNTVDFYARKLEKLRDCPLVIKYHHSETIRHRGSPITVLISELVQGRILQEVIRAAPGGRLEPYEALRILHALVTGVEQVHRLREYHGDLHEGNVLVRRRGVHFEVKVVDLFNLGRPTRANLREDVIDMVRLLYEMVGGKRHYAKSPPEIRAICRGLRRSLITEAFPTAGALRQHLDSFEWSR